MCPTKYWQFLFWKPLVWRNTVWTERLPQKPSDRLNISLGVPQGSILDPILFSIYVEDLAEVITACYLVQYGDDTQFLYADTISDLNDCTSNTEETLLHVKHYFLREGLNWSQRKRNPCSWATDNWHTFPPTPLPPVRVTPLLLGHTFKTSVDASILFCFLIPGARKWIRKLWECFCLLIESVKIWQTNFSNCC